MLFSSFWSWTVDVWEEGEGAEEKPFIVVFLLFFILLNRLKVKEGYYYSTIYFSYTLKNLEWLLGRFSFGREKKGVLSLSLSLFEK